MTAQRKKAVITSPPSVADLSAHHIKRGLVAPLLSVVVPVKNEEDGIVPFVERVSAILEDISDGGGWEILFVPSFLGVKLLARSIGGRTRRHSMLGPVDRVLGGGFGALKGLLGATLFFLLANLATDMVYGPQAERPEWMTRSRTFPLLNASGRSIVDWVEARRLRVNKVGEGA